MPKTRTRNKACSKCGVDIRTNTAFCYNCGNRLPKRRTTKQEQLADENGVAGKNDAETQAAINDLANRFNIDGVAAEAKPPVDTIVDADDALPKRSRLGETTADDKLANAAAERKMARIKRRLPAEYVWTPDTDSSRRLLILFAALIALIAGATVYVMIFWR